MRRSLSLIDDGLIVVLTVALKDDLTTTRDRLVFVCETSN